MCGDQLSHSSAVEGRWGGSAASCILNMDIASLSVNVVLYDRLPAVIDWYGYEIWRNVEKLYWYDSQPHPDEATLQSSHPHHKHIPPDIKHNRIPAPEMSFIEPNLPVLIAEVEALTQAHGMS